MKFTTFLLIGWIFLFVNSNALARVEGAVFPVISDVQITHVEPVSAAYVTLSGNFKKIRRCDFSELKLIVTDRDTGIEYAADVIFRSPAQARGVGDQYFTDWDARVAVSQLRDSSFRTEHTCMTRWLVLRHRVFTVAPIEVVKS